MAKEHEIDLLKSDAGRLYSGITGLPITKITMFPETADLVRRLSLGDIKFTSEIVLGNPRKDYCVRASITLDDRWSPGEYLPDIYWDVQYDGQVINHDNYVSTQGLTKREIRRGGIPHVEGFLADEYRQLMSGPSTKVHKMDYERSTLTQLAGASELAANSPYLALMTSMNIRKLPMPPILSQRPEIIKAMTQGKIDEVERQLGAALIFEGAQLDQRCVYHMQMEAEAIRNKTREEAMKLDPNVDITIAFPWVRSQDISVGENKLRPLNILVVELEDEHYDEDILTNAVVEALIRDGRHGNTTLITETRLVECLDLCKSGRIDMVLLDATRNPEAEVLSIHQKRNSFFDLVNPGIGAMVDVSENGLSYGLADGRVLSSAELSRESENLDIRTMWGNEIVAACLKKHITPPPFFVVKNYAQQTDLSNIIAQKLNMPLK